MRTAWKLGIGWVLVCGLSACSGSNGGGGEPSIADPKDPSAASIARADVMRAPASDVSTDAVNAAVKANNEFAADLYAQVLAGPHGANVLTSPLSASLALTMTYAGAVGDTATEMAHTLHFDPSLGSAIFDGQNALSQALASRGTKALANAQQNAMVGDQPAPKTEDYDLSVVNSVWGQETYSWEQPFLTTLAKDYGSGVYQRDFVTEYEPARIAINDWVSNATKNKINDLLAQGSVTPDTRMVLVNALHLKFPWDSPFEPSATKDGSFTRADGSTVTASFMTQAKGYAYSDDGMAQIAALPLSNRELSVVIALPHEGIDLASYEASLAANSGALAVPSSSQLLQISLPKVNFTTDTFYLTQPLHDLGMVSAFSPTKADFTGLCAHPADNDRLFVSDVVQKAMISMQETGVEAAAATAVLIAGKSAYDPNPPQPVPMVVNRPYLVALIDNPTGAVLMLGHIADPTDEGSK